ncbi:MAG: serine acetyltransferase [Kiritimatiellae bacterium]|nr:serine acetyltransferase [Kiritimatiellia bacterium]
MSTIEPWIKENLEQWKSVFEACSRCPATSQIKGAALPSQYEIIKILNGLIGLLFPGCLGHDGGALFSDFGTEDSSVSHNPEQVAQGLYDIILPIYNYYSSRQLVAGEKDPVQLSQTAVKNFLSCGGELRELLRDDIRAAYEGDPAARSELEVVMSYPGLYAICVHRIAHKLFKLGVPLIPRVMSEYAHSHTGIDIHPGATIGSGFFIDHGTGVVIGETCTIGKNVKLYQGVTLGALSFAKDENGNLVKGNKRHPDVEDNVIIYAGATILGGDTVIGHDSVIGGNVWLVHSVPPFSKVYNSQPSPTVKSGIINSGDSTKA